MAIDTSQFFQIFFDETEELLQQLEALLLDLDMQAPDVESLHAIFRIAHSIKGNAATFGFSDLTDITHVMESLLDEIRHGHLRLTELHRHLMLEAKDVLKMQLDGLQHGLAVDAERVLQVREMLEAQWKQASQPGAAAAPAEEDEDLGFGFFEPLEELPAAAEAAPPLPPAPAAQPVAPCAPESSTPSPKRDSNGSHGLEASTIRVNIDKVDQLINLVGELVITQAMISACGKDLDPSVHDKLVHGIEQLSRNTRDLQDSVMSIRMMPMDFVFSRFPRLVHELSSKLGKRVEFVTEGGATELDKGLIEKIVDPLTHLVRNSVDHGIEAPLQRQQSGKSEAGLLRLSATHQGSHIVIEVVDDGAGLDRAKILRKAAASGLAVSNEMSDQEVWQLICLPGFSTAETVTDVSGRGVGMDVVRRNITSLGGTLDISSSLGQGTRITISLPLTLAILDGISVRVGSEIYILPLSYVVESFQPAQADLRHISGQGMVIRVRGEYLPVLALHELFGIQPRSQEPSSGILVVVQMESRKAALWIDEVIGQHQIVVKNLETHYRKVPNISGATILWDGSVSLIVDVAHLLGQQRSLAGA
ncbi:chemotaxis protein CheA [Malikia granosa]|uniref:Chemotaxis protein CheA n=1 Tax=Malikia granosa TaxID=263067 RepID=A0A2S9K482_9BURK|nr:chemotaxis protein CheW [Malikia granosa]PRD65279.1 chemotaxis protein CheA [Malikia granosa]